MHYDLPRRIYDSVHRSGRTGRFGRQGLCIGLANGQARGLSPELLRALKGTAPAWLRGMAISAGPATETVRDVRRGSAPSAAERREAQKLRSFAEDAYGKAAVSKLSERHVQVLLATFCLLVLAVYIAACIGLELHAFLCACPEVLKSSRRTKP